MIKFLNMKKSILALTICLFCTVAGLAQEGDKISLKGNFIEIDMKCTTAYRNFQANGKNTLKLRKF